MYKDKKVAVVVPAHNEEPFITEVIETMPSFVDRIYVTNDGSTDSTGNILSNIASDRLVVMTHSQQMGAGAAMLSGYKRACANKMDVIAIMAGDGQMDPAILDRILDPIVEGKADYSKGDRLSLPQHKDGMPAWRAFGNFLLTYLTRIASGYRHVSDPQNGYTAISRGVLERVDLNKVETGFAFENDLLVKLHVYGARVVNVPHPARYRGERSKIKYLHFMATTSWLLLKDFLWRLWVEYARRPSGKTQG
jgi:glycosyltransferase involved in cell wall biosynthesis